MRRTLQIAGMGLSALVDNWARSALTMLGIVIGVSAVVLLTSLGNGVQEQITGQIDDLGPNLITIAPGSGGSEGAGPGDADGGPFGAAATSTLTPEDTELVRGLPSVAAASSNVSTVAPIRKESYSFSGVDPSYEEIRSVDLAAGRFLEGPKELVLEASASKKLLDAAPEAAVGEKLTIRGEEYTVVGVAKAASAEVGPPMPESSYMTSGDALDLSGTDTVGQIVVSARDADSVDRAVDEIGAELKAAHDGAEDFAVTTQEQLLSTFTQVTDLLTYLLAGIAGISLLVGGIGIMNIMLVSVAERTREIGVRKALGATNADVLLQFLLEAVLLALMGGLVGVALGVGVSALLPTLSSNLPTAVTATSVGLAFGVSALIGVVFGVLPAYRSARLQPVEALRRE